jgi:hypothetical protein
MIYYIKLETDNDIRFVEYTDYNEFLKDIYKYIDNNDKRLSNYWINDDTGKPNLKENLKLKKMIKKKYELN